MNFYVSKPYLIAYQIMLAGGGAYLSFVCARIAAQMYAMNAQDIWITVPICLIIVGILLIITTWRHTKRWIPLARLPLISFDADRVSWRSTPGDSTIQVATLSSISGVECQIYSSGKAYSARVYIQRWAAPDECIDISTLKATPSEVFNAFKDRLPSLAQPRPDAYQLIAKRYAFVSSSASDGAAQVHT